MCGWPRVNALGWLLLWAKGWAVGLPLKGGSLAARPKRGAGACRGCVAGLGLTPWAGWVLLWAKGRAVGVLSQGGSLAARP